MTIRAVAFDAVGTLIHPTPSAPEKYAAVAARYGLTLSAELFRERFLAAFRLEEAVDRAQGWQTSELREVVRWQRIIADTLPEVDNPGACFQELYEHYARPESWQVDPAAAALFDALLSRGLHIGLASNYDRRLERVIDGQPTLLKLQHTIISSVVGVRKPSPSFFAAVTASFGFAPVEILFVGDDLENDYEGATTAGMIPLLLDPENRHPHIPYRIRMLGDVDQHV